MSALPAAHAEKKKLTAIYWKEVFVHASDEYFDQVYFHYGPTNGTLAGYHQYDGQLEDFSRKNIDAEIAALKEFEWKFDDFPPAGLDESTQGDLAIMRDNVRAGLLELETIRGWECELTSVNHVDQMPVLAMDYVRFLEERIGVTISVVGVGPEREQFVRTA